MRYCTRCITPDTRPNIRLDAEGVCNACRSHERRVGIDYAARRQAFANVAAAAKARSAGYDCLIPVSGGKDSHWQTLTCLEYGLKPLTVSWRPPGRTPLGRKNLDNLIGLGVDHIDYAIDPAVERRFMLKTFERLGSTAVPMHLAIFAIPLRLATRLRIPLVVWGENSAFEYGQAKEEHTGFRLDREWLSTYGVTHGTEAPDWVDADLTAKDLTPYLRPSDEELERAGVLAVFLGYYFPWDPQQTGELARAHGFAKDEAGPRTGYYDFADIDDDFISLHHYMKWYKFGFTRLFDNLSLEIRNGRLSREEAVAIVQASGDQTPRADIEKFCAFAGISRRRFDAIAESFRNPRVWTRKNGVWMIEDFLVDSWEWS